MHIFYFIFVQFMQFPVLHFALAHSGSRPFNSAFLPSGSLTIWKRVTSLALTTVLMFFFPFEARIRHRFSSGSGEAALPLPLPFGRGFVRPLSEEERGDIFHEFLSRGAIA